MPHFLLFVITLALVHAAHLLAVQLILIPSPETYEPRPLWWLIFVTMPVYLVPVVFGFGIKSWKVFPAYVIAAVLLWQISAHAHDWVWQRAFPVNYISLEPWFMVWVRRAMGVLVLLSVGVAARLLNRKLHLP